MANTPISVLTLRQIIRLYCQGNGIRTINGLLGISRNTLRKYIRFWDTLELSYDQFKAMSDHEIFKLFYKEQIN